MIKTFNINLAGQIFNINEDAYEQLSGYFNTLRTFYANEEDKDEIIRDIESRFAELFLAKGKNYIITKTDTTEVINMMGNPQEFDEDAKSENDTTSRQQNTTQSMPGRKRLYRDSDNGLVAGVCAGLSNYIGINDPIWIRIAFILLTLFTFGFWMLLIYPILWFIMPEAITASEKLEMKGEVINLGNIQKTIQEDSENAQQTSLSNKSFGDKLMTILGGAVKIFFKIILGIIILILGLVLIGIFFGLIGCLIALIVVSILALFGIPIINSYFFENGSDGWFLGIGGLLIGFTPIIFTILALVHIISKKSKPLKRNIVFPLIGLFLFGFLLLNISGYHAKQLMREKKRVNQTFPLNYAYKSDTLQLTINPALKDEDYYDNLNINGFDDLLDFINDHDEKFFPVEIEIYPSASDSFSVIKEYSSNGSDDKDAIKNATSFTHTISQINNKLIIDPYIQFENSKIKFRNQKLKIKVYVPEGKVIRWDERTEKYMDEGKLAINWDNVKGIVPPIPPIPPVPGSQNHKIEIKTSKKGDSSTSKIVINIDSDNQDINDALDKAQQKIDEARQKIEEAETIDISGDSDEELDNRLTREHYIFRMVNGELIAID